MRIGIIPILILSHKTTSVTRLVSSLAQSFYETSFIPEVKNLIFSYKRCKDRGRTGICERCVEYQWFGRKEMAGNLHIDAHVVARRCSVKSPDYSQLTSLDWVVLDFTDGLRTFDEMLQIVPTNREDLAAAYIHLRLLGILTWNSPNQTASKGSYSYTNLSGQGTGSRDISRNPNLSRSSLNALRNTASVSLEPTVSGYSDEVCAQYLPPKYFTTFRRFEPTLTDKNLDIPVEVQAFIEFIHDNLASFSPYDLLGLPEGQRDKAAIKQAYLLRTKQFHPDRYFRKNTGPFAPRIAAIFKAVTNAYTTLQSR